MRRLLAASAAVLLACRPPETKPAADAAQPAADAQSADTLRGTFVPEKKPAVGAEQPAADTLRGTFVLEGSDPYPMAVMRTSSGRVVVDGASAGMLKLSQLDLWLRGTRTSANRFRVTDYRVRGANGAKAWDGVLRSGPTGFRLELDDGSSHVIRGAPSSFAQLTTGSRLWLTESPDGTVREYGVF